ncbi:response regulator [Crenothrix sp.]|uniref:response regulator n=1 Tax=Crenothrix sp. TaxID=3100433 RepID=UPI00374D08F1
MINKQDIFNASILIVDDQHSNVLLLEEMLRDAGYSCIASTTDPTEVYQLHQKNHYALILLDLKMPGMDGFQVMEGLKELETKRYLPVLVITAEPNHKLQALGAGAKDFVTKPFDMVEVKTRIYNMLEVRLLYRKLEQHNKMLEQAVQERTTDLRISEARFRRLAELSSDWYWEQDKDGYFTHVYGPVLDMLGVQIDAASGKAKPAEGVFWNKAEREILDAKLAARQPFLDFVYSRATPNGTRQYIMVSGEPMFDLSGRFSGYCGIGKDITTSILSNEEMPSDKSKIKA